MQVSVEGNPGCGESAMCLRSLYSDPFAKVRGGHNLFYCGWRKHFEECSVPNADLENLAERMDGGQLLGQRQTFIRSDHATPN